MVRIEALRSHLSEVTDIQLQTDGYLLWLVWQGNANPVVLQTLEDYGGLKVAEEEDQALWFFFSTDVLLAAARLGSWSRFNPLAHCIRIFPGQLITSRGDGKNLVVDDSFWQQEIKPPTEFRIWVHASMKQVVEKSPGLSLQAVSKDAGVDPAVWPALEVDPRLPYQSPLSWYTVLRPVGNTQDKAFHLGWREFFGQLEAMLQRNKFRFSVHDIYLMFPLDTLRQVKTWCRDFFTLLERLKAESPHQYWPCVMAVIDRKGMTLNEDLPKKIDVEWDHLVPDYPHMSLRNALMLGEEFVAHEVRFAPVRHQPDDWVSVSLRGEDEQNRSGSLPQLTSVNLIFGPHEPCFYCGQRSHVTSECPSRSIDTMAKSIWPQVAGLDFAAMRASINEVDKKLTGLEGEEAKNSAVASMLHDDSGSTVMLKAFYDITWPVQLRAVSFFWRARNKDLQKAAKSLAPIDSNPIWELLGAFRNRTSHEVDEELRGLATKHSKDFRLLSLRGFWAMERGEFERAEKFWKEAEHSSPHPVVQAWHSFLQARALECRGAFPQAAALYDQVSRSCPAWLDAEYRKVVCMIKNGFTDPALSILESLIDKSGHFFNRALIDPELDRGYIQVLARLYSMWTGMAARAKDEIANLTRMRDELGTWFLPDNPFAGEIAERIDKVLERSNVQNYVAFQMLVTGRARIERDIQGHVLSEARDYKERFKSYATRLREIHEESAWFPFPRTLVEFNRSYNEGVSNNNWAMQANFHTPESFRKAQMLVEQESDRLKKLEGRLRFLRIVRDSTLFILTMAETFLWLEIIGIILIFVALPLLLIYGDKIGLEIAAGAIAKERWPVQKALFFVVTILSIGIAGLRTILRFETIRDKLLTKAREGTLRPGKRR